MAERKYSYNQALKKAGKMITLILDGGLGDELIYRYSPDPVKSGLVAFNRNNGEWRYIKKLRICRMLIQICLLMQRIRLWTPHKFFRILWLCFFYVSVTEPFAVSRGLFLCPKRREKHEKGWTHSWQQEHRKRCASKRPVRLAFGCIGTVLRRVRYLPYKGISSPQWGQRKSVWRFWLVTIHSVDSAKGSSDARQGNRGLGKTGLLE